MRKRTFRLSFFRTLKERLRSHVESLTRQARLKTMKNGHQFMTIESRIGAKKTKSNSTVLDRMGSYLLFFRNRSSDALAIA